MAATRRVAGQKYDLVHAHDWMTFPAGIEIARRAGAPLIVHVHSLEYDRAGYGADRDIVSVERQGLEQATRVIAVSYYTRSLINRVHGTPLDKISVVHNGVYARETVEAYTEQRGSKGPVVLFLGRVTFQKGPEYFVQAAARVLEHVPDAVFVMAGSGDMLPRMKSMVEELGITKSFRFPGFVRGAELERTFSTADVYVMPSVSEPFGIAPLEAMSYDRPVIVSKQSGVSEVLQNALKVDFWDVDKLASQIVALLELPELRRVIVERAREEIRHIHWDAAAEKLVPIYRSVARG
jgi:glycosyltransferase involved in cell wall biosynthesis